MRTTLTLDDDVAAWIERIRRDRERTYKDIVNEALRLGLEQLATPQTASKKPYRTPAVSLGGSLVGDLSNIHEALSLVEGDRRR